MDLHDGTPFWPRRDGILGVRPRLNNDVRCDVAVVGAGITGALIALELTRRVTSSSSSSTDATPAAAARRRARRCCSTRAMLQYEIDELFIDLTPMAPVMAPQSVRGDDPRAAPRRRTSTSSEPSFIAGSATTRTGSGS